MTNITKEKWEELIDQVKATDDKPYVFIATKEMIEIYKDYISHLGNVKILIQKSEEAEKSGESFRKQPYIRDLMRFIQILDEAIGAHD